VTPIDTATDTARTPIAVGTGPFGIAITPDQAPTAAFTATPAPAGSQTGFDASASSASPGQTLASYHWDFGDGSTQTTSSATTTHAYATAGNHTATLTVTDDAGCSTEQTFTGQTLSCNGSAAAQTSHQVTIAAASPALSTDASADVSLGGPVHDTATLSGGAAPGGQITFRLYGPGDAGCSGSPAFTDTKTVSGNGGYDSSNFTPTQPGTYRWTADYGGDADNDPVAGACNDAGESVTVAKADQTITFAQPAGRTFGDPDFDPGATASSGLAVTYSSQTEAVCTIVAGKLHLLAAGECKVTAEQPGDADYEAATPVQRSFQVAKATPTLVTAASPGIVLGAGSLGDTATLAGGQGTPTGTITFKLYGPDDASCTGGAISTSTKPISGNGPYSSDPFTPTAAGTYQWSAEYSGDSDNDGAGGDCGAAGESTVVAKATPTISGQASAGITIGGSVHDTATLAGGFDPTGTIVFKLYGPGDMNCSNAPAFTDTQNVDSGNGDYPSVDFSPTAAGDYRWTASYPGDAGNEPVAGTCADPGAAVTVAKAATTTALAASPNPALRATPSSLRLTATLDGGAGPSGQVSFLDGTTPIGSAPLEGGKAILTPTGLAAGSHQITARYEGDANNQPSASAPLTVVIEGPAPKVTVTYSPNHPHSPNPKGGPRYAFRFADEAPGVTFYCRLDKAPFKPCHSPRVYRHLKRGHHVFKIKSVDAAGRESAVRTVKFFAGRRR
jgi:PKD repeat protein